MSFQNELARAIQIAPLPALASDLRAVAHKFLHPMAAILAKVPGDSLAARARAIGVSRQTMYVWAQERFRPSTEQATIIAELTGVPIEQIRDYQEGDNAERVGRSGAGKPPRKKVARLAKAGRHLSPGATRLRAKRGGVVAEQGKRRYDRTAVKRSPRGSNGGKSD
jgi:DNA-binding XRE family transcriptional regulator